MQKIDAQLNICGTSIRPTNSARNIGVLFDSNLSLAEHINNTCRSAFFHLRNISKIRRHLDSDSVQTVVHALVINKLDMFNSLYKGLPQQQIGKLKRVHHAADRLISGHKKHKSISPILRVLHWLPVECRIDYKILVLTYKCLHGSAPSYLSELLMIHTHTRTLRPNSLRNLVVPLHKLSSTDCSFTCSAPQLWNTVPVEIRNSVSLSDFKKNLKTFLITVSP